MWAACAFSNRMKVRRLISLWLVLLCGVCALHGQQGGSRALDLRAPIQEVICLGRFPQINLVTPNNPVQGLAVYQGRWLFQLYHHGPCVVADLQSGEFLGQFIMDATENSHNNNACWGVEFPEQKIDPDGPDFPYLYVSECGTKKRCYVQAVGLGGSRLVQEIFLDSEVYNSWNDWIVDAQNGVLYAFGRSRGASEYVIKKFALPKVNGGPSKVYLSDEDKLDEFTLGGMLTSQGSQIHDGYLFVTANLPIDETLPKQDIKVHVFDLATRKQVGVIDFAHCLFEPEGCSVSDGYLYQTFVNARGTVYRIKLK